MLCQYPAPADDPPFGARVDLTYTRDISGGLLWHWEGAWPVLGGAPSQDAVVYYTAVDRDNLSGDGEIGLAIRNKPPAPEITWPSNYYMTEPNMAVSGRALSPEALTIRVWDSYSGMSQIVATTRSVGWTPSLGINWGAAITLTGEGPHPLRADAISEFGLTSTLGTTRTFFLDTRPPTVTLAALSPYTNVPTIRLSWLGNDGGGSGVVAYALDHQLGGGEWNGWTSGGASYTTTLYVLDPEGVHGFRVWAQDQAGRIGLPAVQVITADRTLPQASLVLSENSPYAYVSGATVYHGPATGNFTVTAAATDNLAGLANIAFPTAVSAGGTYPQSGALQAIASRVYTFTASSIFSSAVAVTTTDQATNRTTSPFTVTRDVTPPTLSLSPVVQNGAVRLTWSASDSSAGLATCTLEAQEDQGSWTVVPGGCAGTTTYGTPGHWYTFRLAATDNVGNSTTTQTQSVTVRSVRKYYTAGGRRVAMRENGVVYYLHGDHLGSTSLVTCGSAGGCNGTPYQGVVARQLYLPYGAPRPGGTGTLPTDFTFTGQRADATGLMFFKARYYSSSLGRFLSADTIVPSPGNSADLNRYSYARNNPLNYMDPSGHGPISEWLISVGRSGPVGKSLVVSMGFIAEQPNKVFYPGPNTSMADRWLASTMVGGGSVIAAAATIVAAKWAIATAGASCMSNPERCAESVANLSEHLKAGLETLEEHAPEYADLVNNGTIPIQEGKPIEGAWGSALPDGIKIMPDPEYPGSTAAALYEEIYHTFQGPATGMAKELPAKASLSDWVTANEIPVRGGLYSYDIWKYQEGGMPALEQAIWDMGYNKDYLRTIQDPGMLWGKLHNPY